MIPHQAFPFVFISYHITKLTIDDSSSDMSGGVHIKMHTDLKIDQEQNKVLVTMSINMSSEDDRKNIILGIASTSSFLYDGPEKLANVDQESTLALVNISYDTTRGILIEKLANTKFQKLILPIATNRDLGISEVVTI